jgi:hypothetical protein
MSTDTATNFLGIPIDGDINRADKRTPQRPREDFEPIIKALLDDEYFVEFGWRQYTPYFNDGDPCVFGASGAWVRTQDDSPADEDEDDEDPEEFDITYGTHPTLGGTEGWGADQRYVGTRETQWRVAKALGDAIEGGEFDHVLIDLFGDHCRVTVRRTGITVDEYSHD